MNSDSVIKTKWACFWRFMLDACYYVPGFAVGMIRKLWKNRHKYATGHWRFDPGYRWIARAADELRELQQIGMTEGDFLENTLLVEKKALSALRCQRASEAYDLANFAMMAAFAYKIDED